ncbi:imidazoleglycerol-phosphate dehydratase [Propionibacterium cyclohexanicum]|uniref:Imidazoleglycerol-phosphate dehydratase n=1 Tax=Propionibacterium cyclohexanicum TaxID=64702 RepID=A0A1H9Q3R4_9ACTN|nr:imidazoleglycerol-phosphate dehydratase HisB [Propionibacterium cyclohexanicum]SER55058.1 imidazoleglycerol-phosphate dehydratase [Propionibacterium cyclohexanicum]
MSRTASIHRITSESDVQLSIDLDGTGSSTISTGVGFFDHMLTSLAKHSLIDLQVHTTGDLHIDGHHSVEDTAIALGQALSQALGDKRGIRRFGDAIVPLDEALAQAVVDVAGRPYAVCSGEPPSQVTARIGGSGVLYSGSMTYHVIESLALNAGLCVHLRLLAGREPHHIVEAQFKALARALRSAVEPDPRVTGVPSTKGTL